MLGRYGVRTHTCFYMLVGVTWGWQLQSSQGPFVFAVQGAGVSKAHDEIRFQAIAAMLLRGGGGVVASGFRDTPKWGVWHGRGRLA